MKSIATFLALLFVSANLPAATFFASPVGQPTNTGTEASPWDLQTGLQSALQPGDTLCLRGGMYKHPNRAVSSKGYSVKLQGALGNPIVVRPYRGERAVIDGGIQSYDASPGNHYRLCGLEVLVSENLTQTRTSAFPGSGGQPDLVRPWGGIDLRSGVGCDVVNCYIHDNMQGIGHWGNCHGLIYGNIIVRNGWIAPDRNHGHGIYTQNARPEWKLIQNNLLIDNYELNIQAYGSDAARIDRMELSDNVWVKGAVSGAGYALLGGGWPSQSVKALRNVGNASLELGYTEANPSGDDITAQENRLWHGIGCKKYFTNLNKFGNFWWHPDWSQPRTESYVGDRSGVNTPIPSSPFIKVTPNAYDSRLTYVSVLNFPNAAATSVTVDLSSVLAAGDVFDVSSPYDPFGVPILSGTYSGPVTLPISGKLGVYVVTRKNICIKGEAVQ